jgi:hypothetical protein
LVRPRTLVLSKSRWSLKRGAFEAVGRCAAYQAAGYGEIDPRDPLNALVQDIELAPRNVRGMVEMCRAFVAKAFGRGTQQFYRLARSGGNRSHASGVDAVMSRRPLDMPPVQPSVPNDAPLAICHHEP